MKVLIILILCILSKPTLVLGQLSEIYHDAIIRNIKQVQENYLLHFDHLMHDEMVKYVLNCDKKYCSEGLAYMNPELEYEWIFVPESGSLSDMWEDHNQVYILNSVRTNSKVNSSAKLFKMTLDKKGKLIEKVLITEAEFDGPNGSIKGKFDKQGNIWIITSVPPTSKWNSNHNSSIQTGEKKIIACLTIDLVKNKSCRLEAKYIDFDGFDSNESEVSMLFRVDSLRVNDKLIESTSENGTKSILIQFDLVGNLKNQKTLTSGDCWVHHLKYQNDNIVLGGSFSGNASISDLKPASFLNCILESPSSYISDKPARNSFISSLNSELNIQWLNTISGSCDVLFNSLSTINETVAISFHFKDSVVVAGQSIYGLQEDSKYQYAEPIVCYFDSAGKIFDFAQFDCYSSSWNEVYLFESTLFIHGSFLKSINVYDERIRSESINSEQYLKIIPWGDIAK